MRLVLSIICMTVLCSAYPALSAQEDEPQSPALRHANKARGYADRAEDKRARDADRSIAGNDKGLEKGEVPASVNKALEESNQTFKSLEKSLELLGP